MSVERYQQRAVSQHGLWDVSDLSIKVYGLIAGNGDLTDAVLADARAFLKRDLPGRVTAQGDSNGMGFAIVHVGTAGVTVSAYWWVMGSVLCQTLYRTLASGEAAYPTDHPVVGCVWELGLVEAERQIWLKTMMGPTADPDLYLKKWADLAAV